MLPASQRYQIFILALVTVVREGLETMVFLAGVGNAKPTAIPLPGIVGIICGVLVGVALYYTGKQVRTASCMVCYRVNCWWLCAVCSGVRTSRTWPSCEHQFEIVF